MSLHGLSLLCFVVTLSGCTSLYTQNQETKTVSKFNPRTVYFHSGQLADDMATMKQILTNLIRLESDQTVSSSHQRVLILKELNSLEAAAKMISEGTQVIGYTSTNPHIGAFLYDIRISKEFASQTPPDYQPAIRLIDSCSTCHSEHW